MFSADLAFPGPDPLPITRRIKSMSKPKPNQPNQPKLGKWYKSSKSGPNCDNSVYVRFTAEGVETCHDKDGNGPVQLWSHADWEAFILGAKDGQFDLANVVS